MARGVAGAALFAVPVVVAAAIGFGTSFSGVAGGLSSIANGPEEIATPTTATSAKLNRAVATFASRDARAPSSGVPEGGSSPVSGVGTGTSGGTIEGGGSGSSGGSGLTDPTSTIDPPGIDLPGGGSGGGGGDQVGNTVTGVGDAVGGAVDGVGNTVNGLLGQ